MNSTRFVTLQELAIFTALVILTYLIAPVLAALLAAFILAFICQSWASWLLMVLSSLRHFAVPSLKSELCRESK